MKRFLVVFLLSGLLSCSTDATRTDQEIKEPAVPFLGETEWTKTFGGSGSDTAQAIIGTTDGGYAILGYSNSTDGDLLGKSLAVEDYWLLKLDAGGNLQWNRTYGGRGEDLGQSLAQTSDGGYILTGYAQSADGDGSNNEGFHDNWVIKLDPAGNIQWEKSFGFSGHDHSYDILQTQDGGFFFVGFLDITSAQADGYTDKGNSLTRHGVGEFWGTKLDAQGNIEWRKYFGGTNNDRAHAVVVANDGGFVMAGFSESNDYDIANSKGSYDFWVLKIDAVGTLLWERSYGGTGIDISYDIAKTYDNAYVIVGNTFSADTDVSKNNGESDVWLIKIDDAGTLLWEKTFGGSLFDAAQGVRTTADGGFVIAGNTKSMDLDVTDNAGQNDLWLIKTDAEGNLRWQNSYGGTEIDFGFDVLENPDGSLILIGESASPDFLGQQNKGQTDVVVLKIK